MRVRRRTYFVREHAGRKIESPRGYIPIWTLAKEIRDKYNLSPSTTAGLLKRATENNELKFTKEGDSILVPKKEAINLVAKKRSYTSADLSNLRKIKNQLRGANDKLRNTDSNKNPELWNGTKNLIDALVKKQSEIESLIYKKRMHEKIKKDYF